GPAPSRPAAAPRPPLLPRPSIRRGGRNSRRIARSREVTHLSGAAQASAVKRADRGRRRGSVLMDERELRQLFHGAYDRVSPLRDPFCRVRESSDQRPAQWGYAIAGGLAALMALFTLVALLLVRDLNSAPSAGTASQPVAGPTAPVVVSPVE